MNKKEFVDQVADRAGMPRSQAEKALNSMLDTITAVLQKQDSVSFLGFGSFSVKRQAARQGRNPQTGASITIAARNAPVFKASQALKEGLNRKTAQR